MVLLLRDPEKAEILTVLKSIENSFTVFHQNFRQSLIDIDTRIAILTNTTSIPSLSLQLQASTTIPSSPLIPSKIPAIPLPLSPQTTTPILEEKIESLLSHEPETDTQTFAFSDGSTEEVCHTLFPTGPLNRDTHHQLPISKLGCLFSPSEEGAHTPALCYPAPAHPWGLLINRTWTEEPPDSMFSEFTTPLKPLLIDGATSEIHSACKNCLFNFGEQIVPGNFFFGLNFERAILDWNYLLFQRGPIGSLSSYLIFGEKPFYPTAPIMRFLGLISYWCIGFPNCLPPICAFDDYANLTSSGWLWGRMVPGDYIRALVQCPNEFFHRISLLLVVQHVQSLLTSCRVSEQHSLGRCDYAYILKVALISIHSLLEVSTSLGQHDMRGVSLLSLILTSCFQNKHTNFMCFSLVGGWNISSTQSIPSISWELQELSNKNGSTPVKRGTGLTFAVKTLNHDGLEGCREFLAEINYLSELIHPHLVKLICYCIEDDQWLLVYEFMLKGSLDNRLFKRSSPFSWSLRMEIALNAARGLVYLHEETEKPAIYPDFKTSNILDMDYKGKLSDFGLAQDGLEGGKTDVSTHAMGTYGGVAPEYVMTGHLTAKSHDYSFGVVLLELLTGRRFKDKSRLQGEHKLMEWARPYLGEKIRFFKLIDPRLEGRFSIKGAQKSVQLAACCLNKNAKIRPAMSEVVKAPETWPNLKEMACSSSYFQGMNAGRRGVCKKARTGTRMQQYLIRNGQPTKSPSLTNQYYGSPYHEDIGGRNLEVLVFLKSKDGCAVDVLDSKILDAYSKPMMLKMLQIVPLLHLSNFQIHDWTKLLTKRYAFVVVVRTKGCLSSGLGKVMVKDGVHMLGPSSGLSVQLASFKIASQVTHLLQTPRESSHLEDKVNFEGEGNDTPATPVHLRCRNNSTQLKGPEQNSKLSTQPKTLPKIPARSGEPKKSSPCPTPRRPH